MLCYYYWKNNQYHNICFASVKLALHKRYHLHMCNRDLLWFGELPQWNLYVNGTTFQSDLRFQTGLSSLWGWCKRALRNKFVFLSSQINKNVDILLLSKAKLNDSFLTAPFSLSKFSKTYRLDRWSNGGGILLYTIDDIHSRLLTDCKIKDNLELFFIEVSIPKKKWLLNCSYNLRKSNISNHLHHLNKGLDVFSKSYNNILIMGD